MKMFEQLSSRDILHIKLSEVGSSLNAHDAAKVIVISDYIRHCLFQLSLESTSHHGCSDFKPVHIRHLLETVKTYLNGIFPELKKDSVTADDNLLSNGKILRWVLEKLEFIGDVNRVERSKWLPAPLRCVSLPEGNQTAVIGGMPSIHLRKVLPNVSCSSLGRHILQSELPEPIKSDSNYWQDYHSWTENSAKNTRITDVEMALEMHGSQSSYNFKDFEVFVSHPKIRKDTRRSWIPFESLISHSPCNGVFLCRTGEPTSFFIGEIRDRCLVRELRMTSEVDIRWIQLGLYKRDGMQASCRWENGYVRFFPSLPIELVKHLLIYAIPIPTDNRMQIYYVEEGSRSDVENFVARYGYQSRSIGGNGE